MFSVLPEETVEFSETIKTNLALIADSLSEGFKTINNISEGHLLA